MARGRDRRDDQSLGEKMKAGEPLMEQAVQALCRYHEAQETKPGEEVEKLRLEAEGCLLLLTIISVRSWAGLRLSYIERNPKAPKAADDPQQPFMCVSRWIPEFPNNLS